MQAAQSLLPLIPIVLIVLVAAAGLSWNHSRSMEIVHAWAKAEGFTVLAAERRFLGGPFFFRKTEGQTVYYVTVRDREGKTRRAHLLCGGLWLGLLKDRVQVKWDEAP